MHATDRYPVNAVKGGCFLLGRYEVGPGHKVMDLDTDLDDLPMHGRLCISEDAVESMVGALGWHLWTQERQDELDAANGALLDACGQLDELMAAMAGLLNIPQVEHAMSVAARKVAGKESVTEWIDSLPKAVKAR